MHACSKWLWLIVHECMTMNGLNQCINKSYYYAIKWKVTSHFVTDLLNNVF